MPIRRSPNGARHVRSQPGRNRPERVVAINRNAWSQSVGTGGRNHPVRAVYPSIALKWADIMPMMPRQMAQHRFQLLSEEFGNRAGVVGLLHLREPLD